ncbi:MazG nucleotide pyrophosphohydrolase domain-containing protein [Listeria costaricensis]|uniref:MazG nucleotide pyrophosphohydrolase domain-containing protein n=1 Tax=Listeria costaricensis TaxID=2026604 RepID=UPI000C081516|nr:MazG-like family protein [Listeria costaricensis]
MEAKTFQEWVEGYYESRQWSNFDIFKRIGFLTEETGEVARAIRTLEIGRDRADEDGQEKNVQRQALMEELGDVLGNIMAIATHYEMDIGDIFESHVEKLNERYQKK